MSVVLKTSLVVVLVLSLYQASLLQVAAWVGMTVSYSRVTSFSKALEMTFDGNHPCSLCKMVKAAKDGGKEEGARFVKTLEGCDLLIWEATEFEFSRNFGSIIRPVVSTKTRFDSPPKPPPRGPLPHNQTRV